MIGDLGTSGEWKTYSTMKMNFTPTKDSDEKHLMHSKSDSKEIMCSFHTEKILEKHFHSLLQRYQVGL